MCKCVALQVTPEMLSLLSTTLACPLEVDALPRGNGESVGDEVILHRGEGLNDVAPFPSHVQVVDTTVTIIRIGDHLTGTELDDVGPVLEGAAKLCCVYGQSEWLVGRGANVHIRVLLHWGTLASDTAGEKGR